jgi:DNA polymerase sigma
MATRAGVEIGDAFVAGSPAHQVKPFGSFVTGLSLPSSDLDMVICLPQVLKDSMAEAPGALEGRNAIKETWQQNLARYEESKSPISFVIVVMLLF